MTTRLLVDGEPSAGVSPLDRGLLYGDGLFETILFVGGNAPLWSRHMHRLDEGCRRLALPRPDTQRLARECVQVVDGLARAVVRVTWTRGVGERGYAAPADPHPTCIVSATPAPTPPAGWYSDGMHLRHCALRMSHQPLLAGIKHLNRLEQVIARAEWSDAAIGDGLLCDADGALVGATAANVFARIDGELVTPPVDRCGVAGVARAEVMDRRRTTVARLAPADLLRADEVFLTSAVRGVVPVGRIDAHRLVPGAFVRELVDEWRTLFAGAAC